jgi:hypothetical protein
MSDEAQLQTPTPAPPERPPDRYVFSGYAVGAAAHCHTLGDKTLDSVIQVPALAASVIPAIGGLSKSEVSNFCFQVSYDTTRRNLISVQRINSRVEGTTVGKQYQTLIEAEIESIAFVDKLHIDSASLSVLSTREWLDDEPKISEPTVVTKNRITGIHLGDATIQVELDDDLLPAFPTGKQIAAKLAAGLDPEGKIEPYRGTYRFNLVKSIVIDQGEEESVIKLVSPNAVSWEGFGTIYFGEVIVKNDDRQVTLVRVEMGYGVGGSGTVGDGHSNGSAGSNGP